MSPGPLQADLQNRDNLIGGAHTETLVVYAAQFWVILGDVHFDPCIPIEPVADWTLVLPGGHVDIPHVGLQVGIPLGNLSAEEASKSREAPLHFRCHQCIELHVLII